MRGFEGTAPGGHDEVHSLPTDPPVQLSDFPAAHGIVQRSFLALELSFLQKYQCGVDLPKLTSDLVSLVSAFGDPQLLDELLFTREQNLNECGHRTAQTQPTSIATKTTAAPIPRAISIALLRHSLPVPISRFMQRTSLPAIEYKRVIFGAFTEEWVEVS
ncbi:hypothetical protein [Bradyrhizobium archetypum]|uniref:Uncharacterized protein n=1 Tax=Bradyrhizobium archetypum TaxID=2721160 RepID=A0A7Y4LZY8_9BRAD|nr:hypothetical protein [Bradyrhizobium archetypum]NOJ44821.1 hypothetical protein [Bradyrhizobium archetypum]